MPLPLPRFPPLSPRLLASLALVAFSLLLGLLQGEVALGAGRAAGVLSRVQGVGEKGGRGMRGAVEPAAFNATSSAAIPKSTSSSLATAPPPLPTASRTLRPSSIEAPQTTPVVVPSLAAFGAVKVEEVDPFPDPFPLPLPLPSSLPAQSTSPALARLHAHLHNDHHSKRSKRSKRSTDPWGSIDGALGLPLEEAAEDKEREADDAAEGEGEGEVERLFEVEGVKDVEGRTLVVTEKCAGAVSRPLLYLSRLTLSSVALLLLESYLLLLSLLALWLPSPSSFLAASLSRLAQLFWAIAAPRLIRRTHSLFHRTISLPTATCGRPSGALLSTRGWRRFLLLADNDLERSKELSGDDLRSVVRRSVLLFAAPWVVGFQAVLLYTLSTYPFLPSQRSSDFLLSRTYFGLLLTLTVFFPILLVGIEGAARTKGIGRKVVGLVLALMGSGVEGGMVVWLFTKELFRDLLRTFPFLLFLFILAFISLTALLGVGTWELWMVWREWKTGRGEVRGLPLAHPHPPIGAPSSLVPFRTPHTPYTPLSLRTLPLRRRSLSRAPSTASPAPTPVSAPQAARRPTLLRVRTDLDGVVPRFEERKNIVAVQASVRSSSISTAPGVADEEKRCEEQDEDKDKEDDLVLLPVQPIPIALPSPLRPLPAARPPRSPAPEGMASRWSASASSPSHTRSSAFSLLASNARRLTSTFPRLDTLSPLSDSRDLPDAPPPAHAAGMGSRWSETTASTSAETARVGAGGGKAVERSSGGTERTVMSVVAEEE
ncbi:hypothetical protein JCM8097_006723 [Rhodosporidiobolus ruineniae]